MRMLEDLSQDQLLAKMRQCLKNSGHKNLEDAVADGLWSKTTTGVCIHDHCRFTRYVLDTDTYVYCTLCQSYTVVALTMLERRHRQIATGEHGNE